MRRTFEQILAVFNSLAPSQRITFAAIAVLIPAGFLFFAWNGASSSMVPLSYGKVFSLDEMHNAEQALKEAGLAKFKDEGRQILAPASEVEKYNAALLQSGSLPTGWAEELEKKLESSNPFMTSSETLRQTREALLAKHLRRMILASPDFEDAAVFWTPANPARSRFSKDARTKATVVVRPRSGHDLSSRQIQALRKAVTYSIPDLAATDVAVYDNRKGETYTEESDNDPMNGKTLSLLREASQLYENRIKNALAHISPDIVVMVNVELDPRQRSVTQTVKYDPKKSVEQQVTESKRTERFRQQPSQSEPGQRTNRPNALVTAPSSSQDRNSSEEATTTIRSPGGEMNYTETVAGLPRVVTVSVMIPEDYYTKALDQRKGAPGQPKSAATLTLEKIKDETEQSVKNIVAGAIPVDPANQNPRQITVSSFVPVKEPAPEIKTSSLEVATSLLSQWGSAVGLALFALWALWMLRGTAPKAPPAADAPPAAPTTSTIAPAAGGAQQGNKENETQEQTSEEDLLPPTLNDRDMVQTMVRNNPELAVAIIGKWLQSAR